VADPFIEVAGEPGLFLPNGSVVESPASSGLFSTAELVESPGGSGLFAFDVGLSQPQLTVFTEPPHVHIVLTADVVQAGTERVTVWRAYGKFVSPVHGLSDRYAAGGFVGDDWEVPLGVPVSYYAERFDAAGVSLGVTESTTVQVDSDPSMGWFSDPLVPSSVVQVELVADFAESLTHTRQLQTYQVGDRVAALLGARGKLEQVSLHCQVKNLADADRLNDILAVSSILVRVPPPTRVPRLLYVVIGEVNEIDRDVQWGGEWVQWEIAGAEVDPTTLDIIVPVVNWQTYKDAFPTWADMKAAYSTWFDAKLNPPGA